VASFQGEIDLQQIVEKAVVNVQVCHPRCVVRYSNVAVIYVTKYLTHSNQLSCVRRTYTYYIY
jgi:hypothetical protein